MSIPGIGFLESLNDAPHSRTRMWGPTNLFRLLSVIMQSTWSRRQLVQGAPCSTTLQRTFRDRQHWQALLARRFTGRCTFCSMPAIEAVRFLFSELIEL